VTTPPTFITLGPEGTCHENALLHYLEFQGLEGFEIVLVGDLLDAIGQVRERPNTFLVQCSAHVQVHLVTERFHNEVFVVDTSIYPTKELGLVVRTDVEAPKSLGIVSATRGYLDLSPWETIADEPLKPVVARHLLEGRYDAGLTHVHHASEHPDRLRLVEYYGAINTPGSSTGPKSASGVRLIGNRVPWCSTRHTPWKAGSPRSSLSELLPERRA
jgi:hypothetical protein